MNDFLKVQDVKKYFGAVRAVDGISFNVARGETLGLVGESGCGKTTLGRTILRLVPVTDGEIYFAGENITTLSERQLLPYRKKMQVVFQDPYESLNPQKSIGSTLSEPIHVHRLIKTRKEAGERVDELLELVGLNSGHRERYPHELSSGQRQRVVIARALALEPSFIICDEPVSALDVSIQAQILNLLMDLKEKMNLTYIFISHDLSVVKQMSDRIAVMYLGKIMEIADYTALYQSPQHPYTQALLSAVPVPDPTLKRERIILKDDVPGAANLPSGCRFRTRCLYAFERCTHQEPNLQLASPGHYAACHLLSR
ncbi:MAG: ABC transporter ATP-binding protein [Clostridiales bacterium]|jgi:oligopeptide transport system ATP-binding protein|nr:ABC transporter ATP-binding protein [Clostridiales bacterium]